MKLIISIVFASLILFSQSVFAQSTYPPLLNAKLGTSGLSCSACHGAGGYTPMGLSWTIPNLVAADADGDGESNGIEVRMGTDFNSAASKSIGIKSGQYFASGSAVSVMTSAVVNDLYAATLNTYSLTGSDVVIGGVSITPTLGTAGPITVAYEPANILTAKVYQVVGAAATELTPVTVNATGSISFTTTDAQPTLFIVGTATAGGSTSAPGGASVSGCLISTTTTPLMMLLAMLTLGLFIRRKND